MKKKVYEKYIEKKRMFSEKRIVGIDHDKVKHQVIVHNIPL